MKLLKNIFNIIIWTPLGLYLLFILTFSIPAVQEYIAQRVAKFMSGKLGTSVSIARLDYSLPCHISLYDVNIRDQQGHDMLYSKRISARIDLLPLADGKVSVSTAQLFGTFAKLYKNTADSKPNFQFVLDSLASKDTTSHTPLDLRINSLIIRHSRVSYKQLDAPQTPGLLNLKRLDVSDISAHIILKVLTEDSLNVNVKRLSLKEQSGLDIKRISLKFAGGRDNIHLENFMLRMPNTEFLLSDFEAHYRFRGDHFVTPSLKYQGSIQPSTITLSDLACLQPSLKTFNSTLLLNADINGLGETLDVKTLNVGSTTGDIRIDMGGQLRDLRQKSPTWRADIHDLALSAKTVGFISENLRGERIDIPEVLTRLGSIHLRGTASGRGVTEIKTHNQLNTDAGSITINFNMDEQRTFNGDIDTKELNLGRLLDDEQFGNLATTIDLSGSFPTNGNAVIKADGMIHQFNYNGYTYNHINVHGQYSKNDIHGQLHIDDPNIKLTAEGVVEKKGKTSDVKLTATISNLSPKAINLTDKWDDAQMSGKINANFTASNLNDAEGSINLSDFTLRDETQNYHLEKLNIESGYQDDIHFITLSSDFGQAEISGDFDYETLTQSFTNALAAKLPTLPGLPQVNPNTKNDFSVSAHITKSDWLQHVLQIPVDLKKPLTLHGMVNDNNKQIALECDIPLFKYKENPYEKCHVMVVLPNDSLRYNIKATKIMGDGKHLDMTVWGHALDNQLTTSMAWDNNDSERMSGLVNLKSNFDKSLEGKQTAHIQVAPSNITLNNATWNILPSYITYSDKNLKIDNFAIRHGDQFLTLDGTASESNLDSINISMRDIDIEYVLDLVDFHAVDFNGFATGNGNVRGIFGDFEADAKLTVRQFEFEHGRMGTLDADVAWNAEKKQIDIHATADDGADALTFINGYVSPEHNYIDLGIEAKGTHLDFAQSFTSSFTSSVKGHAQGAVRLAGPLDAINLTGDLLLNGQVHMSTLGCDYELRNDSLHLVPNEITFVQCPIYDVYGKKGIVTGAIHHQDLTNLTFDIFIDAEKLLAYDFRTFGEDTFYGTVFATGKVGIHGRESSVTIEADVTPQPNSVFVYNAASPDAVNNQEFIEWNKSSESNDITHDNDSIISYTTSSNFRDDLTLKIKINATPDAAIRLLMDARTSDYITLRGNGDLQAIYYNKGGFTMNGTYRVTEGTYGITIQDIIKKNFVFREGGTIVFGGDPYDASLNLQAQHTINGVSLSDLNVGKSFSNTVRVNCLMNITGQPRQPIVDFDLEMPNVNADEQQMVRSVINGQEEMNQQVVYLLAVGRFYPQGANNASEEQEKPSKTSLAMQSLLSGTLSGQINNMLNNVIKSNNWNFGANISTGDEGWNNAEYEGLVSGRLLNNRLLINGQFGYRDNARTASSSFIGDFDISYLLFPNGNLALKVYNQTNDRYFTRSSLNTQGIGIIMKKDFNGFRDLFNIKRKKKKSDK